MKHLANEHNKHKESEMKRSYPYFNNHTLEGVFENLKGQYIHPMKQNHYQNDSFAQIKMEGKNSEIFLNKQKDHSNLAYFMKLNKRKKQKSKVITIIDHDDSNQNMPNQKQEITNKIDDFSQINKQDLIKLPMILNKNRKLTKSQKNKQKQFLSYIYSQLKNFELNKIQKQKQNHENNQHREKQVNRNDDIRINFQQKTQRRKISQHNKGLLFPTVKRHRTISLAQPEQQVKFQSKSKKNQIKLSGKSVVPAQRQKNYLQKYPLPQPKTSRTRPINLISSQMIYNNPISNVKKSVYQLLIRKSNSCY